MNGKIVRYFWFFFFAMVCVFFVNAQSEPQTPIFCIVGTYIDGIDEKPCYWVNGTKREYGNATYEKVYGKGPNTATEDGVTYQLSRDAYSAFGQSVKLSGSTSGIAVENNKVYVSGDNDNKPCYWVDGVIKYLPVPSNTKGNTIGIFVQNGNIAVMGYYYSVYNKNTYCYWINGVIKELPSESSDVTGIVLLNGKVYVTGMYKPSMIERGCYWIDGVKQELVGASRRTSGIAIQ
jgi:hypothetical protein